MYNVLDKICLPKVLIPCYTKHKDVKTKLIYDRYWLYCKSTQTKQMLINLCGNIDESAFDPQ